MPLWEEAHGHSKQYGTAVLWTMLLVGGIGTVTAGPLADWIGLRSHPKAAGAITYGGPDVPAWLDAALRAVVTD